MLQTLDRVSHREDYDHDFFDFATATALRSARHVLPLVHRFVRPRSVVDFGCGVGAWLREWQRQGVTTVFGIDGEYVDSQRLMIADADYRADDLTKRIDLGTRFDLVQSLEVAEHLAPAAAETFINNLTRHSDVILFSAALPGQGGIHHVNEQPFSYWRRKFAARGYQAYDPLRPLIRDNNEVAWWYRYGVLIYANEDGLAALPELSEIFEAEISANVPIGDPSPMALRWRRKLMRQLPRPLVEMITRAYMKRLESASTVTSKR